MVRGPVTAAASLAVERGLQGPRLQWAQRESPVAVVRGLSCSKACGIFPNRTHSPYAGRQILIHSATREALAHCFVMSPPLPISNKNILFLVVKREIKTTPPQDNQLQRYPAINPELPIALLSDGLGLLDENKIGCYVLLLL